MLRVPAGTDHADEYDSPEHCERDIGAGGNTGVAGGVNAASVAVALDDSSAGVLSRSGSSLGLTKRLLFFLTQFFGDFFDDLRTQIGKHGVDDVRDFR